MNTRRWLLWLLIASFLWLLVSRFNEIEDLAQTLSQGIWLWVAAAALLQAVYYILQARVYQLALRLVGVQSGLRHMVDVLLGSMFVNAVAPSGGTAGLALFADDAAQRGQSAARATAGTLLAIVGLYYAFDLLLIISLAYLFQAGYLQLYQVVVAALFLLFTLVLSSLLLLGARAPARLQGLLQTLSNAVNWLMSRLRRPPLLDPAWAAETAHEFTEAATALQGRARALLYILFWALLAHLLNLSTLYAIFRAFRYPVTPGPLLAGYSIGYLFVIMSPSPQGVGFVETIMPLVFTSFGAPVAVATVVVLAYRGLSFWLPLLMGFFLLRRLKSLGAEERALTEVWSVRIVALLTGLLGVINLISAVNPGWAQDLEAVTRYAPLQIKRGGQLGAALSAFALLLLANALWRRKRTGWLLTLIVLLFSAVSLLLQEARLDYRTILTVALAIWLFLLRPHFHARSDPPSVRQGLYVLAAALAFILLYGTLGLYFLGNQAGRELQLTEAVGGTVTMLFSLRPADWLVTSDSGWFLAFSIYAISAVTLVYALLLLVRPVLLRRPATPIERERVRAVVTNYGRGPLARVALQQDKAYFFSPAGSAVAFQVVGRTAIALGDPIGPNQDIAATIGAFTHYCERNDWLPAFFQVPASSEPLYEEAGFHSIVIGREGLVDLQEMDGALSRQMQELARVSLPPLLQQGYWAEAVEPPLPQSLLSDLRLVTDEWVTMRHTRGSGHALSWFDDAYMRQNPALLIHTPAGSTSAFVSLVVDAQRHQVSVDLLRHRPQIAPGTLDLLSVALLQWVASHGFTGLSLGVTLPDLQQDPATDEMLGYIYDGAGEVYRLFDGDGDKAIFQWRPRYLVYPGAASLPSIWTALARVTSGMDLPWSLFKRSLGLRDTS